MKKKKVQAIIYKKEGGKRKYLLLHRKLHWVGWEHLKETMEQGESYEDTIRRGVKEETGVGKMKLEREKKVNIPIGGNGEIVHAYVIEIGAKEKINVTKEKEHDDYKWVDKEEALELLTYKNARELLKELTDSEESE